MTEVIQRLNLQLARIEQDPTPIQVPEENQKTVQLSDKEVAETRTYREWIQYASTIIQIFKNSVVNPSEGVQRELLLLKRQEIALMYRANVAIKPPTRSFEILYRELSAICLRYKHTEGLYPGRKEALSEMDTHQIGEVCLRFPVFAETLIQRNSGERSDDPWTIDFIKFCLRSPGAAALGARQAAHLVKIFIELPNETDQLMGVALDKIIGAVQPGMIQVRNQGNNTKALCMRIHGAWVRVQGKKETLVDLPNLVNPNAPAYQVTVKEIYTQFGEKNDHYHYVEIFQKVTYRGPNGRDITLRDVGVVNWNSIFLGSFNPVTGKIDEVVISEGWLSRLPVWRVLDSEGLQNRYPGQKITEFGLVMRATRTFANKHIAKTHALSDFVFPDPDENGHSRIIPFGFQPDVLPETLYQTARRLEKPLRCLVHIPDASSYMSNRQNCAEVSPITPDEFKETEKAVGDFVIKGRQGEKVFHAFRNCATHNQRIYDKVVGKRFYPAFEELASVLVEWPEGRVHDYIKRITKGFDAEALHELSFALVDRLIEMGDLNQMGDLLALCLNTLSYTLGGGSEVQIFKITNQDARQKIIALFQSKGAQEAGKLLKQDLVGLIKLTFDSHQFYKVSIFKAEVKFPYVERFFNALRRMEGTRWKWFNYVLGKIRNFVLRVILFLLGSWRGYSYQKRNGESKTIRVWNDRLYAKMLNLPPGMFDRPTWKEQRRIDVQRTFFPTAS